MQTLFPQIAPFEHNIFREEGLSLIKLNDDANELCDKHATAAAAVQQSAYLNIKWKMSEQSTLNPISINYMWSVALHRCMCAHIVQRDDIIQ